MPKGSQGQKRKADVIGNAVLVMKIVAGEAQESAKCKTVAEETGRRCAPLGGDTVLFEEWESEK